MTGAIAGYSIIAGISLLACPWLQLKKNEPLRSDLPSRQIRQADIEKLKPKGQKHRMIFLDPGLGVLAARICGMDVLTQMEIAIRRPFCQSSVFINAITNEGRPGRELASSSFSLLGKAPYFLPLLCSPNHRSMPLRWPIDRCPLWSNKNLQKEPEALGQTPARSLYSASPIAKVC